MNAFTVLDTVEVGACPRNAYSLTGWFLGIFIHPRRGRGGGNVGIGFIDFQGLWEGWKTVPSFSGLSTNRHFHRLPRSPRTLRRRSSPRLPSSFARTR